jgi:putative ABC transport system permease protein
VILVVTISLTSREYILEQIQAIGSNMIYAYYEAGSQTATHVEADFIKWADVEAIRRQFEDRILAATGVMTNYDRMLIGGRHQDVAVIGSDERYAAVRNLVLLGGRFLDASDVTLRQKVALLTETLPRRLYGNQPAAVGQVLKLHGLQSRSRPSPRKCGRRSRAGTGRARATGSRTSPPFWTRPNASPWCSRWCWCWCWSRPSRW